MKKIPTMFKRIFYGKSIAEITEEFSSPACENALLNGIPTVKLDGACCAIIDGAFYKRYDAKNGKPVPDGAIKCQDEPDPVTGHLPCWIRVDENNPADKWFIAAYNRKMQEVENHKSEEQALMKVRLFDATYEAIGKHFQGNPYHLDFDIIEPHGLRVIDADLKTFDDIRDWIASHHDCEGIVWWVDGEPVCKIKRTDFGLQFPG